MQIAILKCIMSAFISTLVSMECHPDIAKEIWNKYLNSFDRFMVIASKKYISDREIVEKYGKTIYLQIASRIIAYNLIK